MRPHRWSELRQHHERGVRLLVRSAGTLRQHDQYRAYEEAWEAAGYKPKALIKHIVTSPQYCAR